MQAKQHQRKILSDSMKRDDVDGIQKMTVAIAKLYSGRPGCDLEDLIQEAHLGRLEAEVAIKTLETPPASVKAYLRRCIHHHLQRYLSNQSFDLSMLSLDEEIGSDDDGDPITRHDVIGVAPTQEEDLEKKEKVKLHGKVANNRMEAQKKAAKERGKTSRIDEVVALRAQGLCNADIARKLGVSRSAITQTLAKLKKKTAA